MATQSIGVELPDDLIKLLGSPERAAARAREALVLDLLRQAEISQGKAAELLGINRYQMLDLMALHKIPSGPQTVEEVDAEIGAALRLSRRD